MCMTLHNNSREGILWGQNLDLQVNNFQKFERKLLHDNTDQ